MNLFEVLNSSASPVFAPSIIGDEISTSICETQRLCVASIQRGLKESVDKFRLHWGDENTDLAAQFRVSFGKGRFFV